MSTTFVQFCMQYSSIALLYYDYFLTFPLEIKYIWRRRFTINTILYICCRYALLANLLYLFAISNVINNCDGWYTVTGYLSVAGRTAVLAIFTARTWATCGKSKIILLGLGALAVVCIAIDFWHVSGVKCSGSTPPDIQLANKLLSILVCAFECIGTALNVQRCLKAMKVQRRHGSRFDDSIMYFMLREGLIYFCGVFVFTFTAVVLNFEDPSGFMGRLLNALTLPVSGLLSARLVLNLREWSDRTNVRVSKHTSPSENIQQLSMSFHAATVGRLTGSDEFGSDPLDDVRRDLDVNEVKQLSDLP
ncbi:hypothetical protein K503DRAFT_766477 [Rhizopogon vinicolor AM-OR11-026]|uniref:DUF6533 domain-containing protein n=1 Tax=Rhizopogon vinicolor AM-OR11-026 TaxID=1314800 RepID=A0A1B7ND48_9AGAM|nr:hypothetical protein K503DRAFT_766477 [Rhizopogon vinicolor AM-OR11-026]